MTTDGPASSVRHTDPKTRFLAAALISFSVAFATGIPAAVAAVLLSLVLIALFRPNGKELKKRLLAANAFILFLWVFTPFTTPGTPVWSIGPLEATDAGVRLSLLVTLKCNAIIASLFSLTAGLTLSESAMALQKLGLPPKLVMLLLFTGRYIESFSQEYKRLRDAARSAALPRKQRSSRIASTRPLWVSSSSARLTGRSGRERRCGSGGSTV